MLRPPWTEPVGVPCWSVRFLLADSDKGRTAKEIETNGEPILVRIDVRTVRTKQGSSGNSAEGRFGEVAPEAVAWT